MTYTVAWFCAFAVLLGLEILSTGFVCVFFSFGALAASVAAWLGLDLVVQLGIFSVVSVGSLFMLRRHMRHIFVGRSGKGDDSVSPLLHQQGVVVQATSPQNPGEVSINGSFWRAVSAEVLPPDTPVRVTGVDRHNSLLLHVAKIPTA